MNILIAEDEQDIRELLSLQLGKEGYKTFLAEDGLEAMEMFKDNSIDLAILDVMMPRLDGFGVLKAIREISDVPVIFLTARTEDVDKILGLGLGADDYMTKPFNPMEVIARVQAQLRRYYKYSSNSNKVKPDIVAGELRLNKDSCSICKEDVCLELNAKEYKLLELFMENVGKVYTKKQLYETVWEDDYYGDDNTIMVHVSHLREKIEDNPKSPRYLKTVRGIGYKFEV